MIWSQPTARAEETGAARGFPLTAGPGPLQAVTVTAAASTRSSANARMAKVHHLDEFTDDVGLSLA